MQWKNELEELTPRRYNCFVNPFTFYSIVHYNGRYLGVQIRPMTRIITETSKKGQETKSCNLEREYGDCTEETKLGSQAISDAPSAIHCAVTQ